MRRPRMRRALAAGWWLGSAALCAAAPAAAQGSPARAAAPGPDSGSVFLPVGTPAPDFQVQGATRYGVLAQPIRLSQFLGKTVVLAFYFRVRGCG